jgi:Fe2+ or Zn2+ uptake regulation protein
VPPTNVAPPASRAAREHHVRCRRCGAVEDLAVAVDLAPAVAAAAAAGYAVERESLTLTGLCAACRAAV